MVRSGRRLLFSTARAVLVTGLLAAGCGSSPPVDQNFGTNLGADFVAPVVDAGAAGAGGAGGSSDTGTGGSTDTGGTAGMGGAGGATTDGGAGGASS